MELIKDNVRVDLCYIEEGINGNYNPDDPDDIPLLRFDVYVMVDNEWEPVDDASYCTMLPLTISMRQEALALSYLMEFFYSVLHYDPTANVKKLGERLSWINIENLL